MATDISKSLKKLSKSWSKTEARTGGSQVKDGEYTAELVSMTVGTSKNGRLQVAEKFKIASGKLKGKEITTYHGLENENNIAFFKGHCEVIGVDLPDDMEDLPDALESFVDDNADEFSIRVKTNDGGYQNVTVVGTADEDSSSDEDEEESEDSEEEESEDSEEEEEEEEKSSKKKKKSKDEDEEEEESEEESEDEDEGEVEDEEEEKPKKKKKAKKEKATKKKKKSRK